MERHTHQTLHHLEDVEHLRLCAEWGLGEGDIGRIDVRGVPLSRFTERLPHTLLRRLHPDVLRRAKQ